MGRELKRVPLDFAWPPGTDWDGYKNPYLSKCPDPTCTNGQSLAGKWLDALVRFLMLLGSDDLDTRRHSAEHPWITESRRFLSAPDGRPGAEMMKLTAGLAGREPSFIGHDAIDSWSAYRKIVKAAGAKKGWGTCRTCKGHGDDPKMRKKAARWKPKEPPKGDGYQLWQTTSEGGPVGPVFATLDALCQWAEKNATTFGSEMASAAEWRSMLDGGLVSHREGDMVFI